MRKTGYQLGSGMVASMAVHAAVLCTLSALVLPTMLPAEVVLLLGTVVDSQESLTLFELKELRPQQSSAAAAPAREMVPVFEGATLLARMPEFDGLGNGAVGTAARQRRPFADLEGIPLDGDVDAEPGGDATFFGLHAQGRDFVFIVDCSVSMAGPKWNSARQELAAALKRLATSQRFCVFLFDGNSHLMPLAGKRAALLAANESNIAAVIQWIDNHPLGFNTSPSESVTQAMELKPDAIFLLSDGEFADKTARILRYRNSRQSDQRSVKVHTIAFDSREGSQLLRRIAEENEGNFRYLTAAEILETQ